MPEARLPSRFRVARRMALKAIVLDPWRSAAFVVLASMVAASGSLFAFWFRRIINDLSQHHRHGALSAAVALAGTILVWSLFDYAGSRAGTVVSEKARRLADEELISAVAGSPGLDIHETPEHLAQLERLETEGWEFGEATSSLVAVLFNAVWATTTFVLLATISPWLLLLALAGLPSLAFSGKTNGLFVTGNEAAAEPTRRAEAWWRLATTSAAHRELRVFGAEEACLDRFSESQAERRRVQRGLQIEARLIGLATRSYFAAGYLGAVVFVVERAVHHQASAGDVILTAALAGQVLNLVNRTAEVVQWSLRTLTAAGRFVYLLGVSERTRPKGDRLPPEVLTEGIRLSGVSYHYPGSDGLALAEANLFLPAGATVAIVGDNGAGKSTLVKLLCGLYSPDSGRIEIDGIDLAELDIDAWRARVSACFQDFARLELSLRESVGVGNLSSAEEGLPRLELPPDPSIREAIDSAGAGAAFDRAGGLDGVLGLRYAPGAELSVGQWQLVSLGRAATRHSPLLLVLDEPTAALDPEAERDLWDRYTSQSAAAARRGGITVIVSHRLSTVRSADLIAVTDSGRIVEVGTHDDLVQAGGPYAELFQMQARAYS